MSLSENKLKVTRGRLMATGMVEGGEMNRIARIEVIYKKEPPPVDAETTHPRHRPFYRVPCHYEPVLGVRSHKFQKLATRPRLKESRAGQDNTWGTLRNLLLPTPVLTQV